jgi:group I intron endonuclease
MIDINWKIKEKGIYYIKNIVTNQIYIGSTRSSLYKRIREHLNSLKVNKHHNIKLQRSYNKYGLENFIIKVKPINKSDYEILLLEESLIKRLKPYYNICKEPTKGGKPNKGVKLSKSWKNNIREKSLLYKHSEKTYKKVSENNKKNSCKIIFSKEQEVLSFDSWVEAMKYFNSTTGSFTKTKKDNYYTWKGWKITRQNTQKKKVKLYISEHDIKIFESSYDCDKFLNMWRGATSTYLNRDGEILGLRVEYIN